MKVQVVALLVVLSVSGGQCGLWSSFVDILPFVGSKNATAEGSTTAAPILSSTVVPSSTASPMVSSTMRVPQPCVPEETLSPTLQYIHDHLPPQYAALITPDNIGVFGDVGTLAGLATSAATGNPIAIVKLVMFLTSPDNPIPELFTLTKEILPLINPAELSASFGSVAGSTSAAVNQEIQHFTQNFLNTFKKPVAPTTLAP